MKVELKHPMAAALDGRLQLGVQAKLEDFEHAAQKMARSWAYYLPKARSFSITDVYHRQPTVPAGTSSITVLYFSKADEGKYAI